MCGIVGVVGPRQPQVTVLRAMTRALQHRGPDNEGFYRAPGVALGHRRLSIIDLSAAGRQPMRSPDGQVVLVYNGELYNYRELREELEAAGVSFATKTDTEVLLHAYRVWGLQAVERFNGMFAFALWDARTHELHLVRDRFGVKPLYYARVGSELLFASEAKALFAHPDCTPRLNPDALNEYLTFQNVLSNDTFFAGVALLAPGTILTFSERGLQERQFWKPDFLSSPLERPQEELVAMLRERFATAVKRQLVADVPVAAYLSSGIDSSSIVAVAAQQLALNTFTCGFDMRGVQGYEAAFDERHLARRFAQTVGTRHAEIVVGARDLESSFPELIFHLETPRMGMSFPNKAIAQRVAKENKLVLAGTGGDELFGGYPWRYLHALGHRDHEAYAQQYYRLWQRIIPDEEKAAAYGPALHGVDLQRPQMVFRSLLLDERLDPRSPASSVKNALAFEFKTFLHGLLLLEDHLGMAHSIETRFPFLENELVAFAERLPASALLPPDYLSLSADELVALRQQRLSATQGKRVLRDALAAFVPDLARRPKQGFSAPVAAWFRTENRSFVKEHLLRGALAGTYLKTSFLQKKLAEHLSGTHDHRLLLWSLLSLEFWLRTWT